MRRKLRKEQGITIIALIITIVVMLILVAVSVNIIIKSNVIGTAEKTVNKYKTASEEEGNNVKITIGGKEYNSIEDYLKKDSHDWQYTDGTRAQIRCTCAKCKAFDDGDSTGRTLTIGQQIGETEYKTATSSISKAKSGDIYYQEQTINLEEEETKWVVFGYEDKDKDGVNEGLLLTTEKPTKDKIFFRGPAAYNNEVDEVSRMCKELYGSNTRVMTIEDVNEVLGYEPTGGMYILNYEYKTIGNFTTKLKDIDEIWPEIVDYNIKHESGLFYDPSNTKGISDNGAFLGEYVLDGYAYSSEASANRRNLPTISSNIADNTKAMVFGSDGTYFYWLASRGVSASTIGADFDAFQVNWGYAGVSHMGGDCVAHGGFVSNSLYLECSGCIRPLVSLTSEIPASGDLLFSTFTAPGDQDGIEEV